MSDDESIVEEEYLIYADLRDNDDPNIFKHAESSFKSFALDSDQPLLIIGGQAFVGTYKDTVGTAVFLEEAPSDSEEIDIGSEPSDPLFVKSPSNVLRYVAHTRKTLEMSRVLLIEKKDQAETNNQDDEDGVKDIVDVASQKENECIEPDQKDGNFILSDSVTDVHQEVKNALVSDNCKGEDKVMVGEDNSLMLGNERLVVEEIEQMKINDGSSCSNL
ncbi:hypothetical protein J437_LFUL015757 [Ladona fulva]|uniref:Transcription factor TFIIIC triple barrel domain-containing protein n=1 Tax=Ladona fulva TaxID=123851 RepID=A0A8K0P7C2_LADFU|nr:hypothetical protein J437_LFUL015757 [Ladona fulva]